MSWKGRSVLFRWRARWRQYGQKETASGGGGDICSGWDRPAREGVGGSILRVTEMPGALAEALFITNAADVRLLASEGGQWALARDYIAAVEAYFEPKDQGGEP